MPKIKTKIKTNKWKPAGEALKLALKHEDYSADEELCGSTTYMCDVVMRMADAGAIPSNQYMSYDDLWRAINTTYSFGLCGHLRSANVYDSNVYDSNIGRNSCDGKDRVKRLKVGRIFWGAVSKHILSRRANIVGIRNAGYNAVRDAVAKGKL